MFQKIRISRRTFPLLLLCETPVESRFPLGIGGFGVALPIFIVVDAACMAHLDALLTGGLPYECG
jgi:hypothetical protein